MSRVASEAVVVGAGPNGLAAAIVLAQAGASVRLFEAQGKIGGGAKSAELTLPGFVHDVCSAVHPLAVSSPFFAGLELGRFGLEWIWPEAPLAHPLPDGRSVFLERSLEATVLQLKEDGQAYRRLFSPLVNRWEELVHDVLAPAVHLPRHPFVLSAFGLHALRSARGLARSAFRGEPARALFAGLCAHSFLALDQPLGAAYGLILGTAAHAVGWPIPRGGAQRIADALGALFASLGGEVLSGWRIESLEELPEVPLTLLDVTPRQLLSMAASRLPKSYARSLERYRYGPGVFKMDWALSQPIPWRAEECRRAGTVHLGGTLEEIAQSEALVAQGTHAEKPFVILAQPSLFDPSRAPLGKHTAWAYCHVPNGSTLDMTQAIEAQIERFAPGFGQCILARHTRNTEELERENPNCVGGDINGGVMDLRQFVARPVSWREPYATALKGIYLCSASTPPGGGVHGMCGYHAAHAALESLKL